MIFFMFSRDLISVVDPHHLDADPDEDLDATYHFCLSNGN